jgi:hypothetical protein
MKKILVLFIPLLLLYAPTRTFYSDWGWGYYYWLFGPVGPSVSEGMAAAGFSTLEYRGFTQFSLGGWPGNGTQITSLQLRLLNNTGGAGLQININRVTSSTPGWDECGGTAPVYLTNQPVNPNVDEYTYFDLTGTPARDDFLTAWQGGASWFGLGLKGARGSGEPTMHFFYAFWADNYYDAALVVDYVIGVEETAGQVDQVQTPLIAVAPNPFRTATYINIEHSAESIGKSKEQISEPSELQIYDIQGRLIRSFTLSALPFALCWNGTDHNGRSVPDGVYLFALRTPSATVYVKVVRLK